MQINFEANCQDGMIPSILAEAYALVSPSSCNRVHPTSDCATAVESMFSCRVHGKWLGLETSFRGPDAGPHQHG